MPNASIRPDKSHNLVAVYGSLKKGLGNHRLLVENTFICNAKSVDEFNMHSLGAFPCITHEPVAHIDVEIYSVTDSTFEDLDHLEGHPHFYCREEHNFRDLQGNEYTAWIYFIAHEERYLKDIKPGRDQHNSVTWYKSPEGSLSVLYYTSTFLEEAPCYC